MNFNYNYYSINNFKYYFNHELFDILPDILIIQIWRKLEYISLY